MPDRTHAEKITGAPKAYNELLASHDRLLKITQMAAISLESLVDFLPEKREQAYATRAAEMVREEITAAKSLQGGK